jgi:hypothetical protein
MAQDKEIGGVYAPTSESSAVRAYRFADAMLAERAKTKARDV